MVASLTFGFWNGLFYKPEYKTLGGNLIEVFPNVPEPVGSGKNWVANPTWSANKKRVEISQKLNLICAFRNRIAHQEPIILARDNSVYLRPLDLFVKHIQDLTTYMREDAGIYDDYIHIIEQQKTRIHNFRQR
jgi:hypothetical protein